MLVLNNVEVRYLGSILALRGIYMEVDKSKIVCLLGANGAGKSTALKAISGLLRTEEGKVTGGNIQFEEERIDNLPPEDIVRKGIVQVCEGRRIFESLNVEETLRAGAYAFGNGEGLKKKLNMVYNYFPKLKDLKSQTSGYLSGGEQQMLVIGRALMAGPELMLLDEASLGLSPLLVEEIFRIVKNINVEKNTAVLLVEQNAIAALSIAEYGYVMENGKIVLDGPAAKLRANEDIREFYMGLSDFGRKTYRQVKHYKRRKRWLV